MKSVAAAFLRVLSGAIAIEYQVLASNLLTSSSCSFSLNVIPMHAGEYVTLMSTLTLERSLRASNLPAPPP